jgi:ATP-dependent Clp protease ATP-binding subunit ClpC
MAPLTLKALLQELTGLSIDDNAARFEEILAELINHADALADELPRLATSLCYQHRCAAAAVFGRRKRAHDIPALLALLGDANLRVRRVAARACVDFPCAQAAGRLAELTRDADWAVREAAVLALAEVGGAARLPALCAALDDDVWNVRHAAAEALVRVADASCLAPLAAALADSDSDVQRKVTAALVKLVPTLAPGDLDTALASLPPAQAKASLAYFAAGEARSPELIPLRAALERLSAADVDLGELAGFGRVLSDPEDRVRLGQAFEREALLDELAAQLARDGNKSFVLVGEPGAGKTQLIHELARRADTLAPPWTVLETSTSEIMVGTKYIGEWETKVRDLVGKIRTPRHVLLYVTDINNIATAGKTSNRDSNFMSLLGSYLRRGEVTIAGESTARALQLGLEQEGAARRLFQQIKVLPTDEATTATILRRSVAEVAQAARVDLVVSQEVLDLTGELAATYYAGMVEPGRSATLLKQVLERRLEGARPGQVVEVGADEVVAALARTTGLPEQLLSDHRRLHPGEVRAFFEERVLGQPEAVGAMVDLITLVKAGLTDPGKPLGVFFFVGPTGVGKTEIAKSLAEYIFGSAERMIRVDLSEYKEYESHEKLLGGTFRQEHGLLTSKVREQPFSVVLLDEFEKAHGNVFDLFLQVFDDGRLTDGKGVTTDFRHTIIIMTSNLGSGIDAAGAGGGVGFGSFDDGVPSEERVLKEVRRFFRPEFVNRIGRIVVFKPLAAETMRKIVLRELGRVVLRSGILRRRLLVDIDAAVVDLLLKEGFSVAYGARPLKRRVEQLVLLPLAREIVTLGPEDRGSLLRVHVDGRRVAVRRKPTHDERREEQVAERLRLKRPDDERVASVKPADLPALLGRLGERVARLQALADKSRLEERKSEIVLETQAPSFWDDAPRARGLLAEMVHLEALVEGLAHARRKLDDLLGFAKTYQRHGASIKTRFERAYEAFLEQLVQLEYKFLGERPEDRRDVFLGLKRIGAGRDAVEALETLSRMYGSWTERRGFGVTPLLGKKDEHGLAEALWLVEGISLYGLLRDEAGLHRFEHGGKGADRRADFVRVDVIARADGERRLPRKEVKLDRGRGEAIAVHLPTGTSAEVSPDVGDDLLLDLLAARVAQKGGVAPADDRVVRRYGIEGRFSRDEATGVKTGHKELLAGGLDELLRARLYGAGTFGEATAES